VPHFLQLTDGANWAIFISIDQGETKPPVWTLLNRPVTVTEELPALAPRATRSWWSRCSTASATA
jgi:hypothetical protein